MIFACSVISGVPSALALFGQAFWAALCLRTFVRLNPLSLLHEGNKFVILIIILEEGEGKNLMRILGIDPGIATIGFGLVEAQRGQAQMITYGAITTPAGLPLSKRLYQISMDMEELISQLKPDVIAVEELFFNTNLTTGIAVAHGRGVILCSAEKCGIPLYEYTPSQVKLAVVGYGKAEKRQVMDMTRRLLHLKSVPRPDDAADALALALCHARSTTSRLPHCDGVKETV